MACPNPKRSVFSTNAVSSMPFSSFSGAFELSFGQTGELLGSGFNLCGGYSLEDEPAPAIGVDGHILKALVLPGFKKSCFSLRITKRQEAVKRGFNELFLFLRAALLEQHSCKRTGQSYEKITYDIANSVGRSKKAGGIKLLKYL
ncbi:hypothetical protein ACMD2_09262 [Ananas comosus]|uniref:Uncharacterized protein n=1 Tax=Ananas comosus TaxID=4615 RepID=A0A199UR79_ANACO|nr:hypothetical protein ACMD2_09262 [Ananas comosus]